MFKKKKNQSPKLILAIIGGIATLGGVIFGLTKLKKCKQQGCEDASCSCYDETEQLEEGCTYENEMEQLKEECASENEEEQLEEGCTYEDEEEQLQEACSCDEVECVEEEVENAEIMPELTEEEVELLTK